MTKLLWSLLFVATVVAQTPQRDAPAKPQTGAARIAGRVVVNDATAEPIRRVILLLNGGDLIIARQTTTDDAGRFVFAGLPAGKYSIQGWRNGFVRDFYGNKRPGIGIGAPIVLAEEQQLDVTMKMTRSAAISGTVTSATGLAAAGTMVRAMQYRIVDGQRLLTATMVGGVSPNGSIGGTVDDRGAYRLYGLPPGDYVIGCSPPSFGSSQTGQVRFMSRAELDWASALFQQPSGSPPPPAPPASGPVAYAPVYFPGTSDASAAAAISVGPGEDRSGIDFTLQFTRLVTLSGQVLDPDGRPPAGLQVGLNSAANTNFGQYVPVQLLGDGKFSIAGIIPGRYVLAARGSSQRGGPPVPPSASPSVSMGRAGGVSSGAPLNLFAAMDLDLVADVADMVVNLMPSPSISGRIAFEDGQPVDPRARVSLVPAPAADAAARPTANLGAPGGATNPDGTFSIVGVAPGRYRLSGYLISGTNDTTWTAKSAIVNGRDVLDEPFEMAPGQNYSAAVTFTNRVSQLSGALVDSTGRPTTEYFVIAFATDRRFWSQNSRRVVASRPDTNGAFRIAELPPGQYYVAAVPDLDNSQTSDPQFLESLIPASVTLTIGEGEKKIQNLRIAGTTAR